MLNHDDKLLVESEMLSGESEAPRRHTTPTWRDARADADDARTTRRLVGGGGGGGAHAPSSDKPVPTTIYCAPPRQDDNVGSGGRENLNFRRRLGESESESGDSSDSEKQKAARSSVFPTAFLQQPLLRKPREALFGVADSDEIDSKNQRERRSRRLEGGSGPYMDPWFLPNLWLGGGGHEVHESTQ